MYSGLAALIQNGGVYIPEENGGETFVPVDFLGGGDMVYINEIMGCVSDFDSNSGGFCCWCECSYGDLHILPDLKKSNGRPTRTLRRQFWSAHLPLPVWLLSPGETQFPFKCPHCCAHFRNEEVIEHSALTQFLCKIRVIS